MPEYLAPGVYVEEVSFRSKSIEGVSTSTAAFVGPTRKGPVSRIAEDAIAEAPELITSMGNFERIYGGLGDLALAPATNYLAHAVRAFFNNGGSRLYVARVFGAANDAAVIAARATSASLTNAQQDAEQARFRARFPGQALNGRVTLRLLASPATARTVDRAPEGSMLRVSAAEPARPARLEGGVAPFFVQNDQQLLLQVNGTDVAVTFRGFPAEVTANVDLDLGLANVDAGRVLTVTLDGVRQSVTLPEGTPPADVAQRLNVLLRGGYARLEAGRIVIGSDRRGRLAAVAVEPNPTLGFTAQQAVNGAANAQNSVGDLARVTADDLQALLQTANIAIRATQDAQTGRLTLTSRDAGENATFTVRDGQTSAHAALGLPAGQAATGTGVEAATLYVKRGNTFVTSAGTALGNLQANTGQLLTFLVTFDDRDGNTVTWEDLGFDAAHPRYVGAILRETPSRRSEQLEHPIYLEAGPQVDSFELFSGLFGGGDRTLSLAGGSDGGEVTAAGYTPGLRAIEALEDISIVAAPGYSAYPDAAGIQNALIAHVEARRRYRIAVVDTPPAQTVNQARNLRGAIDSRYAALYYPWVVVSNPLFRPGADNVPRELALPPSGFVCGIYARNDARNGVAKSPANEVVFDALRFESDVNFAQQEVLNPIGVNCLRYLSGRGYRVWGARTATSDPEWKYVNLRRYFNYLEASIDRGTQWVVFENNGNRLWANVRETISNFLYNEWVSGSMLGSKPEEAFFVRCDRTTMTQNDLDNGRLVCLIGVAAVRPAEFVIFRIGQKTVDFQG